MRINVERLTPLALLIAIACLSLRFTASADDAATAGATSGDQARIALLDVGRVFKESEEFKADTAEIRGDMADLDRELKAAGEALSKIKTELQKLSPGTADYIDLQQQIATETAKLQAKTNRGKARTVKQEAEMYAAHYENLLAIVDEYSRQNNIRLVWRHNTEKMDAENPKSVLNGINRFVVFEDQLDITDEILSIVNQ